MTTLAADFIDRLRTGGLIAVIRADSADQAIGICRALDRAGVDAIEIAMTTPDALRAIECVVSEMGDRRLVGVGTVLDAATARDAARAGADFIFAPNVDVAVIEAAKATGRPVVPGALTPTEIALALRAGADLIKLFPANYFGPKYIKDILGPLPEARIVPTGGVDLDNATTWLEAGAVAVGVGTSMIRKDLVREAQWDDLTDLAARYVQTTARPKA